MENGLLMTSNTICDPSNFKIVRKKQEWDAIVDQCDFTDFYHSYAYHELAKNPNEEPILVCYCEEDKIIALPLLLRNIEESSYKDATSVYGYPGPISKNIPCDFDVTSFQKELNLFFSKKNIVSVFSRLNSFIPNQDIYLKNLGQIESLGKLVYIDLTKTLDEQLTHYHRRLKTYINKSRNAYTVKKADTLEELEGFIELYYNNMKRVNATQEYFFPRQYFLDMMDDSEFESDLLLAICNETGEIAGGAIFMKKNTIIQYHLSGAMEKYLNLNPIKLLIDEMRVIGTEEGYSYLNLGGGLGSKEDSLFYFKSGFSKEVVSFKVWKYIVNQKIYDDLVKLKRETKQIDDSSQYFPLYRSSV